MENIELLTPEIKKELNNAMNSACRKIGFRYFIFVFVLLVLSTFIVALVGKAWIATSVEKHLEKKLQKNLEVWKIQKDLTFGFVEFLETKIFSNPNLKDNKREILSELNQYYAKLYLVFDTKIVNKIVELLDDRVSPVQRYYIYREVRIQLLSNLLETSYDDCPYISQKVPNQPISGRGRCKTFEELQRIYPFIEKGDEPNTFKYLPYFDEKNVQNSDTEHIE